jgi:hypothetical protein
MSIRNLFKKYTIINIIIYYNELKYDKIKEILCINQHFLLIVA